MRLFSSVLDRTAVNHVFTSITLLIQDTVVRPVPRDRGESQIVSYCACLQETLEGVCSAELWPRRTQC